MTSNTRTLLIIEDEPAIADTLEYALKQDGFGVVRAVSAAEGLAALEGAEIALVILDVGLPDMSGFEVLREIRTRSSVAVIMLTARGEEVDRIVGLELGADDYVTKPFSPREVVVRVRNILRRASGAGNQTPSPDRRFAVDEPRQRILYHGKALDLSRYEYRMLALLVRRPGWVFTREKLMEMCWDVPESAMERTVDTHIKTLRGKLKEVTPDEDPIQTHRGVGYSLKEEGS